MVSKVEMMKHAATPGPFKKELIGGGYALFPMPPHELPLCIGMGEADADLLAAVLNPIWEDPKATAERAADSVMALEFASAIGKALGAMGEALNYVVPAQLARGDEARFAEEMEGLITRLNAAHSTLARLWVEMMQVFGDQWLEATRR